MNIINWPVESDMSEGKIADLNPAINLEETHKKTIFELSLKVCPYLQISIGHLCITAWLQDSNFSCREPDRFEQLFVADVEMLWKW